MDGMTAEHDQRQIRGMGAPLAVCSTGGSSCREPRPELRNRGRYHDAVGSVDEVRALSAQWDEALLANDPERVASFMSDDWVYVGPDGVTSKSDIVGWIASGRLRHDRMTSVGSEHMVHAGDTITLTVRKTSAGTWDGSPYTADEWITEVYVRAGDGWCCTLSQKTPARSDTPGADDAV